MGGGGQIGSGMYSALTERVLAERGSIDIPYPQFQVFRQDGANIRSSVSCMSLDRVTGFFRDVKVASPNNVNVGGPPIKAEDSCTWAFGNRSDTFCSTCNSVGAWRIVIQKPDRKSQSCVQVLQYVLYFTECIVSLFCLIL